ncbi:14-3-3 domain-containing protein [Coprinopsis sp. MPI-PUGE-AT-0042]|nr:14-3-3 domain-containing protein [Coprinopsis sp. MPI-PUGE-AT-0042]
MLLTPQTCLLIAEIAGESERYQGRSKFDVAAEIKKIIFAYNARLTSEERSLLSIAYKNLTNTLRNSWRSINALATAAATVATINPKRRRELGLIQQHKRKIENELVDTCKDIIGLLDDYLLVAAKPGEESVFYSKMKGDYYRYLAEFGPEEDRAGHGDTSLQAYKVAYQRALTSLKPLDPTRLGLALNFAVFYHDVYKSPDRACHLAKSAFDDAVQCLNPNQVTFHQSLRDSLSILGLLRDDIVLWSQEL